MASDQLLFQSATKIWPVWRSRLVCQALGSVYEAILPDFPPVVRIETTNACNARCQICPHRRMGRPVGQMSAESYEKIVLECARHQCRQLHLHNFGEPLLDKTLERKIAFAKRHGIPKVKIFSNGSLLRLNRAASLIESGLDEIKISFDGATREEFEQIRLPLKFDDVVANILELVRIRNEQKARLRILVNCVSTSDKSRTMQLLERRVDGFSFGQIHNWGDQSEVTCRQHGLRKPCSRLWRSFTILANGDVSLCCLDYDGHHLLGHLDDTTTIHQIWHSPAYRQARQAHISCSFNKITLCRECSKSFW